MKITELTENTTKKDNINTEHGLSLYIESMGKKILFDMGQSNLFEENAKALGIDLAEVDIAILSHGHYDHGGGLKRFLELNGKAPVYIHEKAFGCHFSGTEKYIGLNPELTDSPRIVYTKDKEIISEGLTLITCNGYEARHSLSNENMNVKTENGFKSDIFEHEQYLIIDENGKRTVISGCSHKGVLNITEWLSPDILVGGFHFKNVEMTDNGKEKLTNVATELLKHKTKFYTCHCTGTEQYEFMKDIMGENLRYLGCGEELMII